MLQSLVARSQTVLPGLCAASPDRPGVHDATEVAVKQSTCTARTSRPADQSANEDEITIALVEPADGSDSQDHRQSATALAQHKAGGL